MSTVVLIIAILLLKYRLAKEWDVPRGKLDVIIRGMTMKKNPIGRPKKHLKKKV